MSGVIAVPADVPDAPAGGEFGTVTDWFDGVAGVTPYAGPVDDVIIAASVVPIGE